MVLCKHCTKKIYLTVIVFGLLFILFTVFMLQGYYYEKVLDKVSDTYQDILLNMYGAKLDEINMTVTECLQLNGQYNTIKGLRGVS